MKNFSTHLKKEIDRIRLTSAEKQAMRTRLSTAMSLRSAPVRSPYQRFVKARLLAAYSFLGIFIISSGTVAVAAQGALPGDILYPIKVNITEPVETALASSPRKKAEANARFAERRIQEIETLAANGTLDATTTARVAEDFDYHAAQVEKHAKNAPREEAKALVTKVADTLTEEADSLAGADDSTAAFSATLEQRNEQDTRGTEEQSKEERTRKNSKEFADHVRARAWSMKHSRSDDDSEASSTTPSSTGTTTSREGRDDDNSGSGSGGGGDSDDSGRDDDDGDTNDSSSGRGSGDDSDDRDDD